MMTFSIAFYESYLSADEVKQEVYAAWGSVTGNGILKEELEERDFETSEQLE
jgi:hypothetical protein